MLGRGTHRSETLEGLRLPGLVAPSFEFRYNRASVVDKCLARGELAKEWIKIIFQEALDV